MYLTGAKEVQELSAILTTLSLRARTVREDKTGLEALDQADLLWKIREEQRKDVNLQENVRKQVIGYRTAQNGTILFRNWASIPNNHYKKIAAY